MSKADYPKYETTRAILKGTVGKRGADLIFNFKGLIICGTTRFYTDWSEGEYKHKNSVLPISAREDAEINDLLATCFTLRGYSAGESGKFGTFYAQLTLPKRRRFDGPHRHDQNWKKFIGVQEIKVPYWTTGSDEGGLCPSHRELYRILGTNVRRTLGEIDCQRRNTQGKVLKTNNMFVRNFAGSKARREF